MTSIPSDDKDSKGTQDKEVIVDRLSSDNCSKIEDNSSVKQQCNKQTMPPVELHRLRDLQTACDSLKESFSGIKESVEAAKERTLLVSARDYLLSIREKMKEKSKIVKELSKIRCIWRDCGKAQKP